LRRQKGKERREVGTEAGSRKLFCSGAIVGPEYDIEDRERIGEEHEASDPIVEAKLTSGILRVTTKEQDSQGTIQCDMKLTGTDQAELRMLTPPDVTAPKPWKLDRVKVVNKTLTSSRPATGQ
jgi:hypothetical protein